MYGIEWVFVILNSKGSDIDVSFKIIVCIYYLTGYPFTITNTAQKFDQVNRPFWDGYNNK